MERFLLNGLDGILAEGRPGRPDIKGEGLSVNWLSRILTKTGLHKDGHGSSRSEPS